MPPHLPIATRVFRQLGESDRLLLQATLECLVDGDMEDVASGLCARVFSMEQPLVRVVIDGTLTPFVELLLLELTWLATVVGWSSAMRCRWAEETICFGRILKKVGVVMQQHFLDTTTLERLRSTPAWQAIEAEDEAALQATRARVAQDRQNATEIRDRALPKIEAKLPIAQAAVEKARETLRKAESALRVIVQERQNVIATHQSAVRIAETTLRRTAPVEIGETRQWLDQMSQAARGNFQLVDILPVPKVATDPKPGKVRSNTDAVATLMAAAIAGIRRCDELVTAPLTRDEIGEELRAIRASIPRLESTAFEFPLDVAGRPPMFEKVTRR